MPEPISNISDISDERLAELLNWVSLGPSALAGLRELQERREAERCPDCKGNGNLHGAGNEDGGGQWACSRCHGTGKRPPSSEPEKKHDWECIANGSGIYYLWKCRRCHTTRPYPDPTPELAGPCNA